MSNRNIKKVLAALLSLAMVFSFCGCESYNNFKKAFIDKQEDVPIIKIGIFEPISGADAASAADELKGMELAHELYSTVLESRVELVYGDNKSDVSIAPTIAQGLVDEGVSIVLGSYKSVLTLAASDVFKAASMPAITATNTNPLITQTSDFYFRVCYIDSYQGDAAAEYCYKVLEQDKAAVVLFEGSDYNSALAAEFEEAMNRFTDNHDIVTTIVIPQGQTDFADVATSILESEAQAVFFPSSIEEASPVIDYINNLGLALHWIGTSEWDGILQEGVSYTLDYDPDEDLSNMGKTFQEAWAKKYKGEIPSDDAALGFDSYILALAAIRIAGEGYTGETLRDAIFSVKGLAGATGNISISSMGDPTKDIIVEQVTNGEPVAIYTAHPSIE